MDAVSQAGVERVIIEDLVEFGKDEGLAQGLAQGRLEGRLEGEAKLLLRQLALRFRTVPDGVAARVRSASEAELERWGERVLTAASLDEVFAD
jgi:predicted transposase YdaD